MPYPSYSEALQKLRYALLKIYDAGEATAIARETLREITGIRFSERFSTDKNLDEAQYKALCTFTEKLMSGMPFQYAAGHAHFCGRDFFVNSSVLIPRPETEELVAWIMEDLRDMRQLKILDVGTGSGCIPVTLKLAMSDAEMMALDVSTEALKIAAKNAAAFNAEITFREVDFLDNAAWKSPSTFDIIISNPPYIPSAEKIMMADNVRDWEPRLALFVADDEPLIFYRALAEFGQNNLRKNGAVYCEIHKDFGAEIVTLFKDAGYQNVMLKKDMNINDRMIRANW